MDSDNINGVILAVFLIIVVSIMSSCAQGIGAQNTEEELKYIESDCKKGAVIGMQGTHWICD